MKAAANYNGLTH